jgi:hypothetical protein
VEKEVFKSYIELNTRLRVSGTTDFEKDFFKRMNNSLLGKTMENVRNRVNMQLVTSEKQLEKLVKQPNFKVATIFTESLVAVHMKKSMEKSDKPIYLGMAILE